MADLSNILENKDSFEIINTLFKDDQLEFITDLSSKEIKSIAVILLLSDYLELPVFKAFISNVMKLKVSKNRKGRGEFIDAFKKIRDNDDIKKKLESKFLTG